MGSLLKEHSLETDNDMGSQTFQLAFLAPGLVHVSGSQLLSALSGPRFLHQPALFLFRFNSPIKSLLNTKTCQLFSAISSPSIHKLTIMMNTQ